MDQFEDFKIMVHEKDEGGEESDDLYLAIVLGWYKSEDGERYGWCNTGIVVRGATPELAFSKVLARARTHGLWPEYEVGK